MSDQKTWRQVIQEAQVGVERAYEERRRVFTAAHDAGLSYRKIADAGGMSVSNAHKIIGPARATETVSLDNEVPE